MRVAQDTVVIGVLTPTDLDAAPVTLIREGIAVQAAGADIVDIDAIALGGHLGAFAGADTDTIAMLVAGLVAVGVRVSVTTDRPDIAGTAAECGAAWIIDPSGAARVRLDPRVADSGCGLVIGPWGHPLPSDPSTATTAYADGLIRNAARLLDAGIAFERIRFDAGAGFCAEDPEPWRMLNELGHFADLGYPLLVPATEELLLEMVPEEASERQLREAAIAITAVAAGVGAWAIRTHRVELVADLVWRMHAHVTEITA